MLGFGVLDVHRTGAVDAGAVTAVADDNSEDMDRGVRIPACSDSARSCTSYDGG